MSVGNKIRKLRELKNYTQAFMADQLELSLSGYGKIERDETDLTLTRLQKIADVLGIDYNIILSFDEKHIFNFYNYHSANGIVQNQTIHNQEVWEKLTEQLKSENNYLKGILNKLTNTDDRMK